MPVNPDYRLYLESEFKRVHQTLDSINEQTIKTNNRVNCIEDKVGGLEKELLEYRFFKKYPKLAVMLIVMFVIMAGFTVYRAIKVPAEFTEVNEKIETEIRMHGGVPNVVRGPGGKLYMKINNQGLSDTIRIK